MAALAVTAAAVAGGALGNWSLVKLEAAVSSGAVCLDGSPGAYYIRSPLAAPTAGQSGQVGWMVFHEGGGWCLGDANCFERSQTDLGLAPPFPAPAPSARSPGKPRLE